MTAFVKLLAAVAEDPAVVRFVKLLVMLRHCSLNVSFKLLVVCKQIIKLRKDIVDMHELAFDDDLLAAYAYVEVRLVRFVRFSKQDAAVEEAAAAAVLIVDELVAERVISIDDAVDM